MRFTQMQKTHSKTGNCLWFKQFFKFYIFSISNVLKKDISYATRKTPIHQNSWKDLSSYLKVVFGKSFLKKVSTFKVTKMTGVFLWVLKYYIDHIFCRTHFDDCLCLLNEKCLFLWSITVYHCFTNTFLL